MYWIHWIYTYIECILFWFVSIVFPFFHIFFFFFFLLEFDPNKTKRKNTQNDKQIGGKWFGADGGTYLLLHTVHQFSNRRHQSIYIYIWCWWFDNGIYLLFCELTFRMANKTTYLFSAHIHLQQHWAYSFDSFDNNTKKKKQQKKKSMRS